MDWLKKLINVILKNDCYHHRIYDTKVYYKYFKISGGVIDGIGRQHANLYIGCDRCGKEFCVGHAHIDKNGKIFK